MEIAHSQCTHSPASNLAHIHDLNIVSGARRGSGGTFWGLTHHNPSPRGSCSAVRMGGTQEIPESRAALTRQGTIAPSTETGEFLGKWILLGALNKTPIGW